MRTPHPFPGKRYGANAASLDGLPTLLQAELDACAGRALVCEGAPGKITRCWVLAPGATWSAIPRHEQMAAAAIIRSGGGVLVLALELGAEAEVAAALIGAVNAPGLGGSA